MEYKIPAVDFMKRSLHFQFKQQINRYLTNLYNSLKILSDFEASTDILVDYKVNILFCHVRVILKDSALYSFNWLRQKIVTEF